MLCVVWLQAKWRYHREKIAEIYAEDGSLRDDEWPMVTVQLPVYNERNVIERLIRTVAKLDYPLEKLQIQVLDDSTDETSEIIAKTIKSLPNIPIDHVRRPDRTGFKAGAMDSALKSAKGEFVAVFDADFVPDSDFLRKIIFPFLKDSKIGVVQAQWGSLNENENLLTKLQTIALSNHFNFEQFGRCYGGLFLNFNGTCGAWRKITIADAGGWEHDTLCEDLDLSFRAQMKGWKILYLKDIIVPGEIPNTIQALKLQQYRWSKGGIQSFKKLIYTIVKADVPIKIKFFAAAHLSGSTIYIWMFLTSILPVLYMPYQPQYVPKSFFWLGLAGPISALIISQGSERKWKNILYIPLVLAMGYGMALNSLQAVLDGLKNQGGTFARTPKQGNDGKKTKATVKAYKEKRYPWGELFFLSISVAVILFGNVTNPFFYVTHLFYSACYTLMAYFFYRAYLDEDTPSQQTTEEDEISNDVAPHVEITIESTGKPMKGGKSSGVAMRTLMQWGFIVFLVILGRSAFGRFPYMSNKTSNHILAYLTRPEMTNQVPDQAYSSCPSDLKANETLTSFSEWDHNNFFYMNCRTYPYSYKPATSFHWIEYSQPIILKKEEYVIARCGNKLQFHVKNQFNKTALRRASYIQSIVDHNELTDSLSDETMQVDGRANILVLVVDGNPTTLKNFNSFPKTSSFLKYVNEFESLRSFTFNNYRPAGMRDGGSEVALTSGCGVVPLSDSNHPTIVSDSNHFPYQSGDADSTYEYHRMSGLSMVCSQSVGKRNAGHNHDVNSMETPMDMNVKDMYDLWLWNKYQKLGYVTLYGDETCNTKHGAPFIRNVLYGIGAGATQFFNKKGGYPNDHVYGVHTCERYFAPKCYGSNLLHNNTFSYLNEFWTNYQDASRIAYVHVESNMGKDTQKESITLDTQLSEFLEKFYSGESNSNTIVAIVGNPTTQISSTQDVTSFLHLIVPTNFLNVHSISNTLAANQQKLVTSYDIYSSLSNLAKIMYPQSATFNSADPTWGYNLFSDIIPSSRNCEDARLPSAICH